MVTAVLIVAPLNLFWQIPLGSAYLAGLRIDYLIPKLYLSWLITLLIIFFNGKNHFSLKNPANLLEYIQKNAAMFMFGVILFVRQFFTDRPEVAVTHFMWLLSICLFIHLFDTQRITKTAVALGSWLSLTLQLFVGWWQLLHQHSLAAYYWLGETNLANWFGITKGVWFGREVILPYGTTAHPNILANTIVVLWWLSWLGIRTELRSSDKNDPIAQLKLFGWILMTIVSIGLIIATQSLSALLAAGFALILAVSTHLKPTISRTHVFIITWLAIGTIVLVPVLLLHLQQIVTGLTDAPSWSRRNELFSHTVITLSQQPWLGTGLVQSIITTSRVGGTSEIVRFVQPVHTVFWLVLVETGVVGMLGIMLGIRQQLRKLPKFVRMTSLAWLLLVPAAALDHFWLSQWPGILLVALLFATSKLNIKE